MRASKVPLFLKCSASAVTPAIRIEGDNSAADVGTAVHAKLSASVKAGAPVVFLSAHLDDDVASEKNSEIESLFWQGWRLWEQVRPWFPDPQVEVEMSYGCLTGHVDVFSVGDGSMIRVGDWKSGRLDADAEHQLRAYAWLALQRYPAAEGAWAAEINIRAGEANTWLWSREELGQWYAGLVEQIEGDTVYRPGRHCQYCPRGAECPAKTALLVQAAAAMASAVRLRTPYQSHPDDLLEIHDRRKLIESACEMAGNLIRAEVAAAGGVLRGSDGRELRLVETCTKEIDYAAGKIILRDVLGDTLEDVLKVGKMAVEAAVKEAAGKGQKSKAIKALMDRLAEAGAIREKWTTKLEVKRAAAITDEPSPAIAAVTADV